MDSWGGWPCFLDSQGVGFTTLKTLVLLSSLPELSNVRLGRCSDG